MSNLHTTNTARRRPPEEERGWWAGKKDALHIKHRASSITLPTNTPCLGCIRPRPTDALPRSTLLRHGHSPWETKCRSGSSSSRVPQRSENIQRRNRQLFFSLHAGPAPTPRRRHLFSAPAQLGRWRAHALVPSHRVHYITLWHGMNIKSASPFLQLPIYPIVAILPVQQNASQRRNLLGGKRLLDGETTTRVEGATSGAGEERIVTAVVRESAIVRSRWSHGLQLKGANAAKSCAKQPFRFRTGCMQ